MVSKICGFVDPTNPTLKVYADAWTPDTPGNTIEAYTGWYSDQLNPTDQGCKGKQLPGDPTIFYFVAAELLAGGGLFGTHLVKAKYNTTTKQIELTHKLLGDFLTHPSIPGVIAIPKPNQLTVTTGGRVFMPVGSYDLPIAEDKQYYLDVTGTLSDDSDDWTITPRYIVSSIESITQSEGTFCMCLSQDEAQILFIIRIIGLSKGNPYYQQWTLLVNIDIYTRERANQMRASSDEYKKAPLNIEMVFGGTNDNCYTFVAFTQSNIWSLCSSDSLATWVRVSGLNVNKGRAVSVKSDGNVYVINKSNECPTNPNVVSEYSPSIVVGNWILPSINMSLVCPQGTPTHLDVYLPTDDPWTASGLVSEQGSVRQGAPTSQDWEKTAGYCYDCTAAPREEYVPIIKYLYFTNKAATGQFIDVDMSQSPPVFTRTSNPNSGTLGHVASGFGNRKNIYSPSYTGGTAFCVQMTYPPGRVAAAYSISMNPSFPPNVMSFPSQPNIDNQKIWLKGSDDQWDYLILFFPVGTVKQQLTNIAGYYMHVAVNYGSTLIPNGGTGKKVYMTAPAPAVTQILEFDIDSFPSAPTIHTPPASGMNYCVIDINGNFWSVTPTHFWKCANSDLSNPTAWTSYAIGATVNLMGFDTDTLGNIWLLAETGGKSYIYKCSQTGSITSVETSTYCNYPGVSGIGYEPYNLLRVNKQLINVSGTTYSNLVFFLVPDNKGDTIKLAFFNPDDGTFTEYTLVTGFIDDCFYSNIAFERVNPV